MRYKRILFFDLFCAALTTLCDIILPQIMSYLTNAATDPAVTLTAGIVLRLAAVYLVLRLIDGAANYYMSANGHIMGVYIETDMRRDAFAHLQRLSDTYYSNTKVGQIMGRITNDLFDVTEFAHHCPEEFFIAAIKIAASFVILCTASIPLTLIVFACVPLMAVVSIRSQPQPAGGFPPPAPPDRRAERRHRGQPAGRAGHQGLCRRGAGERKVRGRQPDLPGDQKDHLPLYGGVQYLHPAV